MTGAYVLGGHVEMNSAIALSLDPQEWQQLLNELSFLLKQVYGVGPDKDYEVNYDQIRMQVPNIIDLILSMIRFHTDSEVAKIMWRREGSG